VAPCARRGDRLAPPRARRRGRLLRFGQTYARPAGVEHNIVNASGHEFRFIELELK
jgi:hypothetical protein